MSFKYTPSFQTDVQKTFDRIRREQQAQTRQERPGAVPRLEPGYSRVLTFQGTEVSNG